MQIVWEGNWVSPNGHATVTRNMVRGLARRGVDVKLKATEAYSDLQYGMFLDADLLALTNKADAPPDETIRFIHRVPTDFERGPERLTVGVIYMEATEMPPEWTSRINSEVDALVLPSEQAARVARDAGVIRPIWVVPQGVDVETFAPMTPGDADVFDFPGFRFLSVFEWVPRKGYDALLRAYWREFTTQDDVCLVIKTRYFGSSTVTAEIGDLYRRHQAIHSRPRKARQPGNTPTLARYQKRTGQRRRQAGAGGRPAGAGGKQGHQTSGSRLGGQASSGSRLGRQASSGSRLGRRAGAGGRLGRSAPATGATGCQVPAGRCRGHQPSTLGRGTTVVRRQTARTRHQGTPARGQMGTLGRTHQREIKARIGAGRWQKSTARRLGRQRSTMVNNGNARARATVDNSWQNSRFGLRFAPGNKAPIYIYDGVLSQPDMALLYRQCSAFVLPTRGEGIGLPLMEAAATGLPLVVTGWGGQLDYLRREDAYLVSYKLQPIPQSMRRRWQSLHGLWAEPSIMSLRQQMRHLYQSRGEIRPMALRQRQHVITNWGWDACVSHLLRWLEGTVGRKISN
ncbi:glycosyltransferase [Alicyclobacillus curvatus]|nr:glycosyltransferase [Alicyclobacillus curvatus]